MWLGLCSVYVKCFSNSAYYSLELTESVTGESWCQSCWINVNRASDFSLEAWRPAAEICCFLFSSFLRSLWVLENIAIHLFLYCLQLFIGLFPPAWRGGDEDTTGALFFFYFSPFLLKFPLPLLFPHLIFWRCFLSPFYSHHFIFFPFLFVTLSFPSDILFCISSFLFFSGSLFLFPILSFPFTVILSHPHPLGARQRLLLKKNHLSSRKEEDDTLY